MGRRNSGKILRVFLSLALVMGLLPSLPQWAGAGIIGSSVTYEDMFGSVGPRSVTNEADASMEFTYDSDSVDIDVDQDEPYPDTGTITMYFDGETSWDSFDLTFSEGSFSSFSSVSGPAFTQADTGIGPVTVYGGAVSIDLTNPKILHFGQISGSGEPSTIYGYLTWTFSTAVAPTVTTAGIIEYTGTTATMGGNVTSDGGATVTARGVVYSSTDATPTIGEAGVTQDANGSGTGAFSESVGSLTPNTTYYIRAYATNSAGTAYGAVVSFTTNTTVPGAPTIGTATAGNGQATVSFSAPASNGGAAISAYTVTSSPGGFTGTAATSPITVTGLTNGTAYTFTVTATNIVGTSLPSEASVTVTPKSPQTITFDKPGNQLFGTSPTLAATASSELPVTFTSSATDVCTITADGVLTFINAGEAAIVAHQAGSAAFLPAEDVSQTFTVIAVAPGAPTIGTAAAGDRQASITFTAPVSNGGEAITYYTVTSNPGGFTGTGASSPITVAGLTNGTSYTFTVTATNAAGTSSSSAASNSVTPKDTQTITFTNPGAQNFGTELTLTASASSLLPVTFESETTAVCTITPDGVLTFVTAGTATITAHQDGNDFFEAAAPVSQSFTVNAVVPGAPTIGTATAGDEQASIAFTAPASNGGAAITGYTATSSPGGLTGTSAGSTITVTGLTNGTAYTFTVTATNSAGTGFASAASNSVTPKSTQTITFANPGPQTFGTAPTLMATATSGLTVTFTSSTPEVCSITAGGALTFLKAGPATISAHQAGSGAYFAAADVSQTFTVNAVEPGAPTIGTATAGVGAAAVSFTAPASNGGSDITGYTVTSNPGGFTGTGGTSPITVSGLTNGTAYTFTVTATNTAGTGGASAASNSVTPKGSQTIIFGNPGAQTFGTSPTLTAAATSSLPVTFTSTTPDICTVTAGGTLTFLKAGEATITAHQAGNGTYLAAPDVSQTFTVNAVLPGAPAVTAATAGDGRATVSFTAPAYTGGADVTAYTVTSTPGGFTAQGAASPITVTGLTNGTAYTFTVTATNSAGAGTCSAPSAAVTPRRSSDGDSSAPPAGVPVIVNGETQNIGSEETQTVDGNTVYTVSVNDTILEQKLEQEGNGATVEIPIPSGADIAVGALNGQTVKNMESKDAVLQITTPSVTYTLPASEINIDDVSGKLGETVALKDITVRVSIAQPPENTVQIVEDTAEKNSYQLIVKPVVFTISCTAGDKTVEVSKFNGYVERTVAIPEGVDPAKITTGIVLNADGTFSHVPTTIVVIDGKYYAKINSLTNSTYSVIYNPLEFADMASHWAKKSVNNMGARLIVTGVGGGNFEPDSAITRAQFAAIVVRALGLTPGTGDSCFDDVNGSDWYCGYVETATRYGIITGYGNGNFGPNDKITREQAMLMIARAMTVTGLDVKLTENEADALLQGFSDAGDVPGYASAQVAACLKTGVITGRDGGRIAPKDTITRAEVAVIVERLLEKSGLI